jgi:hypothetical protein
MRPTKTDVVAFESDKFDIEGLVTSTVDLPAGIVQLSEYLATEL